MFVHWTKYNDKSLGKILVFKLFYSMGLGVLLEAIGRIGALASKPA